MQVVQWAGEHGLSYLADMGLAIDWLDAAPPQSREAVKDLPRLEALQYADYIHNIAFRRGLFVRQADCASQRAAPDPEVALGLYAAPHVESLGVDPATGKASFRVTGRKDHVLTPEAESAQALMTVMAGQGAAPVAEFLKKAGLDPTIEHARLFLMAVARGAAELSVGPPAPHAEKLGS